MSDFHERHKSDLKWLDKKKGLGAGKGDSPRPVDREKYNKNYDQIDWSDTAEKRKEKE